MTLRDLEQLQHEVIDQRTRPLVNEVVKAYEAGALRAATVSLWIAVVADLTNKIRYLADSGDGEARNVIENLDRAIANSSVIKVQEYERGLLEIVTEKLDILSSREKAELARLNEDRNLCAHPGFVTESDLFVPDAEAVRAHLVAACRSVFSQRPLSGKRLLATMQSEIDSDAWPNDRDYFLNRFFRSARESVKENITKILIKGSVVPLNGSNLKARRCRESVYAIAQEAPSTFERVLKSVLHNWEEAGALGDKQLIRSSGAYGGYTVYWEVFPATAKARLIALLKRGNRNFLIDERFFVSGLPADLVVADLYHNVLEGMDADELQQVIRRTRERSVFVPLAIRLVGESGSFRSAETNLRLVELCSGSLTRSDVADLRRAIEGNERDQVRWAGGSESILISIHEGSPKSPELDEEWKQLAAWLRHTGQKDGSQAYLYEELCDVVGV